jgi:tripartite-type tricarboxylate transporter receptor subunit TctC
VLYDATAFAINPSLRKLPYDVKKDFIPVSQAVRVPNILVVAKNSPFNTLGDFIKAAEAEPGKYTIASSGTGSIAHMAAELLKKDTGINIVHVPYKGGAPALVDVIGGQVNAYFANVATSLPYITSGQVKALAVTSTQRLADLPNLPTVQESGVKDFVAEEWNGFLLPAGTPPAIVDKLYGAIRSALARPDVKQQFAKLGQIPVGSSPKQFAQFLDEQGTRWDAVVKANHITIN